MRIANYTYSAAGRAVRARRQSGMTLVEVMIAASIGGVVLMGLMMLVMLMASEQRKYLVNAVLQQNANLLEDRITRLIRSMSAREAVALGDPIASGSPFFRKVVVARGSSPIPREQLAYEAGTFRCTHLPNMAVPGTQDIYFSPSPMAVLRNMYFFISEKNDGAPDSSAITVVFQLDDDAMGSKNRSKTNSLTRVFTASMRNN